MFLFPMSGVLLCFEWILKCRLLKWLLAHPMKTLRRPPRTFGFGRLPRRLRRRRRILLVKHTCFIIVSFAMFIAYNTWLYFLVVICTCILCVSKIKQETHNNKQQLNPYSPSVGRSAVVVDGGRELGQIFAFCRFKEMVLVDCCVMHG